MSCMLPNTCVVGIDFEEEHARRCFNYGKIMFNSVILDLANLSRDKDTISKCIDRIASSAQSYNLISEGTADSLKCIEGVCLIIDEAKNHISLYDYNTLNNEPPRVTVFGHPRRCLLNKWRRTINLFCQSSLMGINSKFGYRKWE